MWSDVRSMLGKGVACALTTLTVNEQLKTFTLRVENEIDETKSISKSTGVLNKEQSDLLLDYRMWNMRISGGTPDARVAKLVVRFLYFMSPDYYFHHLVGLN